MLLNQPTAARSAYRDSVRQNDLVGSGNKAQGRGRGASFPFEAASPPRAQTADEFGIWREGTYRSEATVDTVFSISKDKTTSTQQEQQQQQ